MSWLSGQFTTRVIALMPVAIAINIVLGYTVANILKLPIYLDSIGTILVGVLAGPIAGALTGILSNLIWQCSRSSAAARSARSRPWRASSACSRDCGATSASTGGDPPKAPTSGCRSSSRWR